MTAPVVNPPGARRRLRVGLRPLLFLAFGVLVVLVTGGAVAVLYVHQHVAAEEAAQTVFKAALSQAEAELDRLLQPVIQGLRIARDWSSPDLQSAQIPLLLPDTFKLLLGTTPICHGVFVWTDGTAFDLRQDGDGWVWTTQQINEPEMPVIVSRWDKQWRSLNEESRGSLLPNPSEAVWFREAVALCRVRNDLNRTETPDVYWDPPSAVPDVPVPLMRGAFAVGQGPGETVVAFDLRLDLLADAFVGMSPTPGGYAALFTGSGQLLGLTGQRYAPTPSEAGASLALLSASEQPGLIDAFEHWASGKERDAQPFMLRINEAAWWFAFQSAPSRCGPPLVMGVAAPAKDLLFGASQARDNLLLVGLWGMVAALAMSLLLAASLRRPIRSLFEHAHRHGAFDLTHSPWPKSRISEMEALLEAVQEQARESVQPGPQRFGATQEPAVPPDAHLQALFSARKEVRDIRTRVEEMRALLREQETARLELARRAGAQRELLRNLLCSTECREDDPRKAAVKFTEAAVRSLDVARAGLWSMDSDGVLTCLDRYESTTQSHTSGMLLSRVEYPQLFDAMELDPAVAVTDVNAARWSRRLAAALGGAPTAAALIACPLRVGPRITVVAFYEHAGNPREWTVDEENQAITLTQALTPLLGLITTEEAPAQGSRSAPESSPPWDQAPVVFWSMDAVGCLTRVGGAVEQFYGCAPKELVGRSFAAFGGEEYGQADLDHFLGRVQQAAGAQRVTTHRRKDGALIDVRIIAAPIRNADGACTGMAGIIEPLDETARLAEVGHFLRFLAGRNEYILMTLDLSGRILWLAVSPALEDRLEIDLRDAAGRSLHDLLKTWHAVEQQDVLANAVQMCRPQRGTFAAQFPGGSYELEAMYIPLPEAGEVTRVLVCLRDITLGPEKA